MAKDSKSAGHGADKTIKIDHTFIESLQSDIKQMGLDLNTVRQGMNPSDNGVHVGTTLAGLTVKAGTDSFDAGSRAKKQIGTVAGELDGRLKTLQQKLQAQQQNLGYVLMDAKDTELENMSAVDAAALLNPGGGAGGGLPPTGLPPTGLPPTGSTGSTTK